MKSAVIVMAYLGQPSGIAQLSTYFAPIDAHLYVHIDAKVSAEPYGVLSTRPNITLIQVRQEVFWGGFNTVRAVIGAIELAQSAADYGRFVVITEDSIPLVGSQAMANMLSSETEWIEVNPIDQDWVVQRYRNFYCFDSYATNPRHLDPSERFFNGAFLRKLERMNALMVEGKTPLAKLFVGSSWWALSAAAIQVVLTRHREDKRLRESFEFSAIPEEHYFQTILAQANWDRPRLPLMYTDFDRDPKPYLFKNAADVRIVQAVHQHPFLRKIDIQSVETREFVESLA